MDAVGGRRAGTHRESDGRADVEGHTEFELLTHIRCHKVKIT